MFETTPKGPWIDYRRRQTILPSFTQLIDYRVLLLVLFTISVLMYMLLLKTFLPLLNFFPFPLLLFFIKNHRNRLGRLTICISDWYKQFRIWFLFKTPFSVCEFNGKCNRNLIEYQRLTFWKILYKRFNNQDPFRTPIPIPIFYFDNISLIYTHYI